MDRLATQLQRLYGLPAVPGEAERGIVLGFRRAADWPQIAALCRGLADDLGLPSPALVIDGEAGFQVWLAFAEAPPATAAEAFVAALQGRYLSELPASALTPALLELPPAPPVETAAEARWSAFIDPELGGMFGSEPWLDFAPSPGQQADLLTGLAAIKPSEFERALASLGVTPATAAPAVTAPGLAGPYADPRSFLLAVINDPTLPLEQRIAAAQALLPHWR